MLCDCKYPQFYAPLVKGGECRLCHLTPSKEKIERLNK